MLDVNIHSHTASYNNPSTGTQSHPSSAPQTHPAPQPHEAADLMPAPPPPAAQKNHYRTAAKTLPDFQCLGDTAFLIP